MLWGVLVGRMCVVLRASPHCNHEPFLTFSILLHCRLLILCLKSTMTPVARGLLAFTWFSLTAGIDIGKEGVCGSSPASGRKGTSLQWEAEVEAASSLAARGHGSRAQRTGWGSSSSAAAFPCHRPLSSNADGLHGTLQLGLSTPQDPPEALPASRLGYHPPSQPLAWPGMAQHGWRQSRRETGRASQDQVQQDL